jgi:curli biogenesis system outer membrane secretion channel CsgG
MTAEESLLHTKRIYVDSFGDDAVSKEIQAMVVSQLTESSRFIVTENKETADASLKGAGLEKTSQEFHSYNSATAAGSHSGAVNGSWSGGTGSVTGYSSGAAAAIQDSNASTETINEARVAVRLVNRDGDVIWATTQESKGAKYKGASADVAEMVVKQLLHDVEKAERKNHASSTTTPN